MANQKVYNIVINGIKESISEVDILLNQLDTLEKRLKNLGKQGIKIDTKDLKGLEEIKIPQISIEGIDAKALKKQIQQLEKDIANGAKTIDGEYANSLNGLRAKLRDLKAELGAMDFKLNPEGVDDLSQRIKHLNDQVKEMEQDYGTFARNVGNYTESMTDALKGFEKQTDETANNLAGDAEEIAKKWSELRKKIEEGGSLNIGDIQGTFSINQLQAELKRVSDAMDNAINQDEYNDLKLYYDEIKRVSDAFKRLRGQVVLADNQLKTQLTRTINGQTYTWENLTAAVGELEDKLYQMAANGEKNTNEFKNIAKAAAELKTQLRQVDYEIDSMTESSKGIMKMVSMTQGFTAIAQGAVGIGELFGMDSENAMKGIQTMTALQGIASALQTVQEQIKQGTAFGKTIEGWVHKLELLTIGLSAARGKWFELFDVMKNVPTIEGMNDFNEESKVLINTQNLSIRSSRKLRKEYASLSETIKSLGLEIKHGGVAGLIESVLGGFLKDDVDKEKLKELFTLVQNFNDRVNDAAPSSKTSKLWQEAMASMNDYAEGLGIISSTAPKAAKGIKLIGTALKTFVKATIILAVIQALLELLGFITDTIKKIGEWVKGNDKLVNSLNKVETEIDLVNKAVDRYLTNLQHLRDTNKVWITDTEMAAIKTQKLEEELIKAAKALKDFSNIKGNGKSLLDNLTNGDTWFQDGVDSLEEFKKRYEDLQKAVESGKDITDVRGGNWFQQLWSTSSDAKADLGKMQIAVIKDLQNQINNLDLSKGSEEIKRFYELLQDPMYASALANVENLFPEQEWAQVLKKRVEQIQSMYEQFDEASKDSVKVRLEEEKRLTQELVDYQTNITKKVRDNNTEAIEDQYERELTALRNAKRDELDEAQGNLELIVSINKKYNRLEMEMLKRHQEEKLKELEESEWDITDILRRIRDNRLSAEDESLKKHLQELENERTDAIEDAQKEAEKAAKEGHDLQEVYNELILSINIKYDALVKKEKEQYYQDLLDMYDDYAKAMKEVESEMNADRLDAKSADVDINYNRKLNSSEGSFDFNGNYIQEEKKFNQERLKIELDYLEQKKKLDEEYAELDKDDALVAEKQRYEESLKELENFKKEGKATEEEYNDLVEKENELHQEHLTQINTKFNNDLTTINNQYLNDRKEQISQALAENASLYQSYADEVNEIMSNVGKEKNIFGIVDLGASIKQINEAKAKIAEGVNAINDELDNLERKRKSGQISFIDYKQAKEELLKTKETIEQQGKEINEVLKTLLTDIMSQWKGLVDSWVSQVSSLLTTMSDTQLQLIDNQMAEIEHQLELQEEAYERAEEAAEAHKEKMEGIEGELESARGERRLFLLEQLNTQQMAYEKEYAAQQKAAKQKEILEKKQEALEKKRNEQEKKSKVQQAIINTYTAVSNALAVQPWFLGLALSAVALALGLKNVSAIKSTPVYADGGVIQGASHSQGGVKVLGGTAEVEGGEYITNKVTTSKNVDVLTFINSKKKKLDLSDFVEYYSTSKVSYNKPMKTIFADGGQLPNAVQAPQINVRDVVNANNQDNRPIYVSVTEIENVQNKVRNVRAIAGLE